MAESQSSNCYMEKKAFVWMVGTPEEVTKRFEEQARVQKEQQKMLRVQQESINDLKKITQLLINRRKKSKPNASSSKSKGKQKQGESSSSEKIESENNTNSEPPNLHLKRRIAQKMELVTPRG